MLSVQMRPFIAMSLPYKYVMRQIVGVLIYAWAEQELHL